MEKPIPLYVSIILSDQHKILRNAWTTHEPAIDSLDFTSPWADFIFTHNLLLTPTYPSFIINPLPSPPCASLISCISISQSFTGRNWGDLRTEVGKSLNKFTHACKWGSAGSCRPAATTPERAKITSEGRNYAAYMSAVQRQRQRKSSKEGWGRGEEKQSWREASLGITSPVAFVA